MTPTVFLPKLKSVVQTGEGKWLAQCPSHEDRSPSLSIHTGDRGWLIRCFAGCATESVVSALGLSMRDLFFDLPEARANGGPQPRRIADTYNYVDEAGTVLFQVVRFDPKDFRQRQPNGKGGWIWNLLGARIVLYRLPEVLKASVVLIVEGEKDVEAAYRLGLPDGWAATTNSGGAGKWRSSYTDALQGKRAVILPDADDPGRKHAQQIAQSLLGKAAQVSMLALPEGLKDLGAWAEASGTSGELGALLEQAQPWVPPHADHPQAEPVAEPSGAEPDDEEMTRERLAEMEPLEYDRARKKAALRFGVRLSTLDKEIEALRQSPRKAPEGRNRAGTEALFPPVEPWSEPVDGATLLDEIADTISKYISLPNHAAEGVALWTLWSWNIGQFDISPRLALSSPEKRCGKSTLMQILFHVTPRPLMASNASAAGIFRMIEMGKPTLLLDEVDTFITKDTEELRGILNSGHTRQGAVVIRVVGQHADAEARVFSTWCPMILGGIGALPGTIEDRSIMIGMKRKTPSESVAPFRQSGKRGQQIRDSLHVVARKLQRWTNDHGAALPDLDPEVPGALNDRQADCWQPLLAIAHTAGGAWPERARQAAISLSGPSASENESLRVELLCDIRGLYQGSGQDRMASATLCDLLSLLEERHWGTWKHGKPLTPAQLARLLKPFGISSRTIRLEGQDRSKGYLIEDLLDAFSRYIPSLYTENPLSSRDSVTTRSGSGDSSLSQGVTREACHVAEKGSNPALGAGCHAVTAQKPETQGEKTLLDDLDPVMAGDEETITDVD